jgi:hypothetical protein
MNTHMDPAAITTTILLPRCRFDAGGPRWTSPAYATLSVVNADHHSTSIAIQTEPSRMVSRVAAIPSARNTNGAISINLK